MNFSSRLKQLRLENNLTQEELAEKLNLTKANISKYETGRIEPNIETITFLAQFFNVSVDYMLGVTGQEKSLTNNQLNNNNTSKNEKEIEKIIKQTRESLEKNEGLMLSGEPVSEEAIESILEALEYGFRQAQRVNKKYTPKKYRKDDQNDR